MPTHSASIGVRAGTVSAVQIRCGCSDQRKAAADWHGKHNVPCPTPAGMIDHGVIAKAYAAPVGFVQRIIKRFAAKE